MIPQPVKGRANQEILMNHSRNGKPVGAQANQAGGWPATDFNPPAAPGVVVMPERPASGVEQAGGSTLPDDRAAGLLKNKVHGMRTEFSAKTKAQAFTRAKDRCEGCGAATKFKPVHYDHDLACELGGDNSLENCKVLCVPCHKTKTRDRDMPLIAKSRRIRQREMGIRKRSKFPGSRDSKFKKKISGEVVFRN